MGLPAGGKVAVIGYGLVNHWARLGRFRIVAEAPAAGPDLQRVLGLFPRSTQPGIRRLERNRSPSSGCLAATEECARSPLEENLQHRLLRLFFPEVAPSFPQVILVLLVRRY